MSAVGVAPGRAAWRAGLANQTRREAAMWWSTGRWWRQAIVWTALLGGLLAAVVWVLPAVVAGVDGAEGVALAPAEAAAQFAEIAAFVSAVGVVVLCQGVLLDDQRSGLLEWLLSKPLSRPALVLAKFLGHSTGLLVSVVAVPWVAVYALLSVAAGRPWPLGRFVATVALVGLFVVFHLALVLAVSALSGSRGAVLAVPLALLVGADLVVGVAPGIADAVPYLLNRVAAALIVTGEVAAVGPVLATVAWTVALGAAAVWRFARREL